VRAASVGLIAFLTVAPGAAWAQDAQSRACDLAAANPTARARSADPPSVGTAKKIDAKEALSACRAALAADPENPRLLFEMGRALQSNKDDNQARILYERAAVHGYASAQNNLALFYASGRGGLVRNDAEAVRLLKRAAAQGDANSQTALGLFYEAGRGGLPKDEREAARLFKLAADHGSMLARARLGASYAAGGVSLPPDSVNAFRMHLSKYWALPRGVDPNSNLRITVRVQLNPDGTLSQTPTVMEGPPSAAGVALAKSAVKALQLAQPFTMLKAENYNQWKEMELVFDSKLIANAGGTEGPH
jgi:TPR repeat protein